MKKIITVIYLISLTLMANAQTTYYVETDGNNANDGLSEATAFASIQTALDSIRSTFLADQTKLDYSIQVGEGTFTESGLNILNGQKAMNITIQGESAATTIIQGVDAPDGTFRRMFNNPAAGNKNLSLTFNDFTAKNYGGNNDWTSTNGIFVLSQAGQKLYANRCVFSDIKVRATGITAVLHLCNLAFTDCSFININSGTGTAIAVTRSRSVDVKNCVFINCSKDYSASGNGVATTDDNYVGFIMNVRPQNDWRSNYVTFVNNTIVDSKVLNADLLTTKNDIQCPLYFANPLESGKTTGGRIDLTFANNIVSGTTYAGYTNPEYLDINIDATKIDQTANSINFSDCSNNILHSADVDFPAGSTINNALSYTSPELDFIMDGAELDRDTTTTGVVYVTAKGTSIVDAGLASVQTANDINGVLRTATGGDIGATEYMPEGAQYIQFDDLSSIKFSEATAITLSATASSGLAVSFASSDNSVATVSGNTLTPVGIGRVTVTASQAGDATYDPAEDISHDLYFAPDNVVLYISTSGDDSNDGLSEAEAIATINGAVSIAQELFDEADCNDFTLNISAGTFTTEDAAMFTFINNSMPVSFVFNGAGADQTVLQGGDTYPSNVRFAGTTSASDSLSLSFNSLTLDNFTNNNSGGFINLEQTDCPGVSLSFDECNISRLMARQGALVVCKSQTSISITDSYIEAMETRDNGWIGGAIEMQRGDLTITNSVFNGNYANRNNKNPGTNRVAATIAHFQPSTGVINATIINNTFISDSVVNSGTNSNEHATFAIIANANNAFNATIANNIFIGATTDNAPYQNIYLSASTNVNFTTSTNNVMNSHSGFVDAGNDSSSLYTYTSPEINFIMDGDYPEIFTTDNGVKYVNAQGSSVKALALASVAPEFDIDGNQRSTTAPWIGAYEKVNVPSILAKATTNTLILYPNPASQVVYIKGDVARVELYNIAGRLVQSSVIEAANIDVSSLSNGIYFVKCQDESGATIATERLIKK